MADNKKIFSKWLTMLCEENNISDIKELTPKMLNKEIQDMKLFINSEKMLVRGSPKTRTAVLHNNNAEIMTKYIEHLKTILSPMHTLQMVFRIYEDPDEIPEHVFFNVLTTVTMPKLRSTIVKVRDAVKSETAELCIEDSCMRIFDNVCISLGEGCTWHSRQFKDNGQGIDNIWMMKS